MEAYSQYERYIRDSLGILVLGICFPTGISIRIFGGYYQNLLGAADSIVFLRDYIERNLQVTKQESISDRSILPLGPGMSYYVVDLSTPSDNPWMSSDIL